MLSADILRDIMAETCPPVETDVRSGSTLFAEPGGWGRGGEGGGGGGG